MDQGCFGRRRRLSFCCFMHGHTFHPPSASDAEMKKTEELPMIEMGFPMTAEGTSCTGDGGGGTAAVAVMEICCRRRRCFVFLG